MPLSWDVDSVPALFLSGYDWHLPFNGPRVILVSLNQILFSKQCP